MRIDQAKVTVILHFNTSQSEKRFVAQEYKRRAPPTYLKWLNEDIIEIKFEDNECYNTIYTEMIDYIHQKKLECHVFFEYENGDIDISFAEVMEYYPSSLTLLGNLRQATQKEIIEYKIVSNDTIVKCQQEKKKREDAIKRPDLARFANLDLED